MKSLRLAGLAALCCTVWLGGVASAAAQTRGLVSRVDRYAKEQEARAGHFSGALLLARGGRVLLSKGYGMASLEHGVPNRPRTKFRIGSLTKQFTAMSILILQERGSLDVNRSVCAYLPDCPAAWKPVTIHHLLTHSSGLPDFTYSIGAAAGEDPAPSLARNMERLGRGPLEFTPGTKFSYCNSGYVLLGHIIEAVSGKSYPAFVRENIFAPLGMADSGYDHDGSVLKNRAAGYSLRADRVVTARQINMSEPFSAGGLYSTVEDLYLWDQALYTTRLVSEKSLRLMFTPYRGGYGYGWYVGEKFGRRVFSHGGLIEGYAAFIERFPDDKTTVIVLSNVDSTPTSRVARDLTAMTFGLPRQRPREREAVTVDPGLYDAYVGRYEVSHNLSITISKEGGRLLGQATGRPKIELFPESPTKFFVRGLDAQIAFVSDRTGKVTHAVLQFNGHEAEARKVD